MTGFGVAVGTGVAEGRGVGVDVPFIPGFGVGVGDTGVPLVPGNTAGKPAEDPIKPLPLSYVPGTGVANEPGTEVRPADDPEGGVLACEDDSPGLPAPENMHPAAKIETTINAQNTANLDTFAFIDVYFTSYYGKYLLLYRRIFTAANA